MQVSLYTKTIIDPVRSAINLITKLPVQHSVKQAARLFCRNTIKSTNIRHQIDFLQDLRKKKLFPKHINNMRLPTMFQSTHRILDPTAPLKDKNPFIYQTVYKNFNKHTRKVHKIKRYFQRMEISDKYCELRAINYQVNITLVTLESLTTKPQLKTIRKITDKCVENKKRDFTANHNKKLENIKKSQEKRQQETRQQEIQNPVSNIDNQNGVIIRAVSEFNHKSLNLLNKGRNFKITPPNTHKSKDNLKELTEVGVERLVCAVRYANQGNPNQNAQDDSENDTAQNNESSNGRTTDNKCTLKHITCKFDKALYPPHNSHQDTEDKIKLLKEEINPFIRTIPQTNIIQNHNQSDIKATKELKSLPNIQLLMTDKTNKICVMNHELANQKLVDHMSGGDFELLTSDPTKDYEKVANQKLIDCAVDAHMNLTDNSVKRMLTEYCSCPTIYPLAKDHKPNFPNVKIRAVQPIIGSAIEKLDILVSKVLIQITPLLEFRCISTDDFLGRLNDIPLITTPHIQASIDIESMYPTMPTDNTAMDIIHSYIMKYKNTINLFGFQPQHIIEMLDFVLHHTYVRVKDKYYKQIRGIGTGSHSSGSYADIIVDYTYYTSLIMYPGPIPHILCVYVDDAYTIWNGTENAFRQFVDTLNSVWECLNFTFELSNSSNEINFLDVKIKLQNGSISHEFYQKETHSGKYLGYDAHCSMSTKVNIIKSEARRVLKNCSDHNIALDHLERLKNNLLRSGYPNGLVTKLILQSVMEHTGLNKNTNKNKDPCDFVLKIPYINEEYTRKIKCIVKRSGIKARVVTTPGRSVRSLITDSSSLPNTCRCGLCINNIDCKTRHFVYKATCKICNESYIGASYRPAEKRLMEHESSFRLKMTIQH